MENKKISIITSGAPHNTIVSIDGVPIGQIQKIKFKTDCNNNFIMEITFPDWNRYDYSITPLIKESKEIVKLLIKDYPFVKIKYSNKYFKLQNDD